MAKVETRHCIEADPMPFEEREKPTYRWVHHDVEELEDMDMLGVRFKCNSCGHEFVVKDIP